MPHLQLPQDIGRYWLEFQTVHDLADPYDDVFQPIAVDEAVQRAVDGRMAGADWYERGGSSPVSVVAPVGQYGEDGERSMDQLLADVDHLLEHAAYRLESEDAVPRPRAYADG